MAQRPWPRPCGCQVPPHRGASARRRAAPAGRGGEARGALAAPLGPRPAFLGSWGASIGTPTPWGRSGPGRRGGVCVSFGPRPLFPRDGGGMEREELLGLRGRVSLGEAGQKYGGEGRGAGPEPGWQPLALGRRRAGLQHPSGAGLGGRAKASRPQLRRSALGGGSISLAGSRLSVLS